MWVTPASKHYLFLASVLASPSSSLVTASQLSHWSSLLTHIPSILVSQESFLFLHFWGEPTPYLFIFNCHLYAAMLRSIFFCPFFSHGISLLIHMYSFLLDTYTCMSNKHLKFNTSYHSQIIIPHTTIPPRSQNSVSRPTICLIGQDRPTLFTKSHCFYISLKWVKTLSHPQHSNNSYHHQLLPNIVSFCSLITLPTFQSI